MSKAKQQRSPRLVYDHAAKRGQSSVGVPFRLKRRGKTMAVTCVDVCFDSREVPEVTDVDGLIAEMRKQIEPMAKAIGRASN